MNTYIGSGGISANSNSLISNERFRLSVDQVDCAANAHTNAFALCNTASHIDIEQVIVSGHINRTRGRQNSGVINTCKSMIIQFKEVNGSGNGEIRPTSKANHDLHSQSVNHGFNINVVAGHIGRITYNCR